MRHLFGFVCVCALGVIPLIGCGDNGGPGGSGGAAGNGGTGGAAGTGGTGGGGDARFPCTEDGIRAAIAEGGGPHRFACDGPTTVTTAAEIVIDKDVVLDGSNNLRVDGDRNHTVFSVSSGVEAELLGLTVSGGEAETFGGGIVNEGRLTLTQSTVSGSRANTGGGLSNSTGATLLLKGTTVSGNSADFAGGGIFNNGILLITNSTISGNAADFNGGAIANNGGICSLVHATIARNETNQPLGGDLVTGGMVTLENTILEGDCDPNVVMSDGNNIESPGDTCGLASQGDQVSVNNLVLDLGLLQDNGGPTFTNAPGPSSVALDVIELADCLEAFDQRGVVRPQGSRCDVGSVEVVP